MDVTTHYLYPSALFADKHAHEVSTVLGSCVAVCLYDPVLKIGGINHYMLPLWNGDGLPSPKYGNIAIEKLVERMLKMGSQKRDLQAKIFGGWEKAVSAQGVFNIGHRNAVLAKDTLQSMSIPIIKSHLGGEYGRKLKYYTHTGEVLMKFIKPDSSVI